MKNGVTVSQERLLKDTSDRLQAAQQELEAARKQLLAQEEQVGADASHPPMLVPPAGGQEAGHRCLWCGVLQGVKLKEQLEATVQKLSQSQEMLKTNEKGEPSAGVSSGGSSVCSEPWTSPSPLPPSSSSPVISWLNKQLNEKHLSPTPEAAPGLPAGPRVGAAPLWT